MSKRGCRCSSPAHSRFVHFWQRWNHRALNIEVVYFHADDVREASREWELRVPRWAWRPVCWVRGHSDDSYGGCVICGKGLHRA